MGTLQVRNVSEDTELRQGQVDLLNNIFGYIFPLTLRSIVELRIPDIIHSNGQSMSLSQIVSKIDSPSFNVTSLFRVMRYLVHKKIFVVHEAQSTGEALYELTPASRMLLHDHDPTVVPMLLNITHPWMIAPWHHISRAMIEGGLPFEKAHGQSLWDKGKVDPSFNDLFNSSMATATRMIMNEMLKGYKDGFSCINGTLIDVGGGMGHAVAEIVKAHSHIKGINFDLPHVVATAPKYSGVTHIGGDMFQDIPNGDVIFIKRVLHDWGDEDCAKILKNCHKVVSDKKGKVIIAEVVIDAQGNGYFDEMKLRYDLLMMANSDGGKERTENEFNILLNQAGFAHYKIITFPSYISIIEAYPH